MGYAHYSPANVTATETADNAVMTVGWSAPDKKALLRYDSGNAASQLGLTNEIGTAVIGYTYPSARSSRLEASPFSSKYMNSPELKSVENAYVCS